MAKKTKAIQDEANAKHRGATAIAKQRKLVDEKKQLEEQIKQVERKKQVF